MGKQTARATMTYHILAVDVEGQMAKFVAETLRVCRGLDLLMYLDLGTEAIIAVTGEVSFDNQNKRGYEA